MFTGAIPYGPDPWRLLRSAVCHAVGSRIACTIVNHVAGDLGSTWLRWRHFSTSSSSSIAADKWPAPQPSWWYNALMLWPEPHCRFMWFFYSISSLKRTMTMRDVMSARPASSTCDHEDRQTDRQSISMYYRTLQSQTQISTECTHEYNKCKKRSFL